MQIVKGRKKTLKKADQKIDPDLVVAEKIVASLKRVHMRVKKY